MIRLFFRRFFFLLNENLQFFFSIAEFMGNFQSDVAFMAAYGYFFFTGISVIVYIFEMTDVCLTLKNDYENVFFARLAKSLVLAAEEVFLFFSF